jgi:cytochrome c oxidase cbb3-type subunit III
LDELEYGSEPRSGMSPSAAVWVFAGLFVLLAAGGVAFLVLQPKPSPPPPEIAGDPLLARGREIYLKNCATCHGESGRGDGPVAKDLKGPGPGNLTAPSTWKRGERPQAVIKVIADGSPDTAMPSWEPALKEDGVRAVAAYVYYLAQRPIPELLRTP